MIEITLKIIEKNIFKIIIYSELLINHNII
jgi:hypothetical protein